MDSYPESDCIIEDYHISLTSNEYTEAPELDRFSTIIFPFDLSAIKKYEFYIMA